MGSNPHRPFFCFPVRVDWIIVKTVRITLIGKPECHLCEDAAGVIAEVRETLRSDGIETELVELNILDDPELARLHAEDIPVVKIGDKRHAIWRVDREKFAASVRKAARPSIFSRARR